MRNLKRLFLFLLLSVSGFAGWLAWFAVTPLSLHGATSLDFSVSPGLSLRAASQQMTSAGLDFAPWQFTLLARLLGKSAEIKAGSYEVGQGVTPLLLLEKLTRGDVTQAEIVFVEGKTFSQLRTALNAQPDVRHDTLNLSNQEILSRLGANEKHPEGLFFPDTYLFAKNSSDLEILKRAYRAMQKQLNLEWARRDPDVPLTTPYEALILASIIEKETGRAADRSAISAVFTNRLRLGMPLQTDPTVIYGVGEKFDGNLRKRDLRTDTHYNTYTRNGLPPTPIAMPGLASIQAALHPPKTDKLYFVARGDGTSEFSSTLDEHNRAVAKYQRRK
ncbi:MAG: endolytic transglycosylase MltG [Betaproteobacteria bacterium]|nr:endolytic transglycosylase MltG [Betaproteobacteria bacterium]